MAPNVCRKTSKDHFLEATPKNGQQNLHDNFLGKFGNVWAKILCTPKNPLAPTPTLRCMNLVTLFVRRLELYFVIIFCSALGFLWIDKTQGLGFYKNPVLTHQTMLDLGVNNDLPVATVVLRWAMERNVTVMPCTSNLDHLEKNVYSRTQYLRKSSLWRIDAMDGELGDPDAPDWKRPSEFLSENDKSQQSESASERGREEL